MRLAFVANETEVAQQAREALVARYASVPPEQAEVIVPLGGDGFMLRTLHAYRRLGIPFYGMKLGHVGFLMNHYQQSDLPERVRRAQSTRLYPLAMQVTDIHGRQHRALAFNEVALLRQTNQAAHVEVGLDGEVKLPALVCDGVLVSTPAGSTAYNLSAHGPILPLGANVLALTPISPFRPRRWRGAILPDATRVTLRILDPGKRPASITADFFEVRDMTRVEIGQSRDEGVQLMFDPEHNLEQRILDEQFALD
ncbi:NAD kinase [Frateuria aurantia]|uniref:NAD kinase n=1 Tax=Frateuria aurantia (strain ATCC 33424 / DSM 6220 / KCTC 2777 / LMG 1558 / NBRC 3245 / NCIMB 13370) TaxID=767434 RepID=H8L066_FRAAD|nr:NAD kinase [Frateuria aurantia]AFC86278.1 putative sugar kinase [Frateuria aurantia DSM 6220]